VDIENTGTRAGQEVVQLYVSDKEASVPRPVQELKGIKKIKLKPGEKQTVTFELDSRAFSFYDVKKGGWTAEPGAFEIRVGSSSRDIRLTGKMDLK
jgi:beta-glucosidase